MAANSVKNALGSAQAAKAGVSMGDVVWLKAMRNSTVSSTPSYRKTLDKVKTFLQGHRNGLVTAG
ncbi:MAG: hypothetical protein Q7U28_09285 [Aquabacterium sp.]|nr:hypothetical protein [Aquabacterium sp.]